VQAGIRLSYNNLKESNNENNVKIEPRVRLAYKLSKFISLHSSIGFYHQVLSQVEQFKGEKLGFEIPIWELADRKLKVQQSEIYQAGLIFQANNWVLDMQAYRRKVSGINSRAYSIEAIPEDRPAHGSSNITGFDILIKKRIGKFRSWLSYSLSKADLTFKIKSKKTTFPSNYDQRHILDWSNQLRLNNWHLSAGFKICSGLPYTELQKNEFPPQPNQGNDTPQDLDSSPSSNNNTTYGRINAENLSPNSTVNISANYLLKPLNQKWTAHFTASIINLLNTNNIYERSYVDANDGEKDIFETIDKTNLPFTPNISLRFEW